MAGRSRRTRANGWLDSGIKYAALVILGLLAVALSVAALTGVHLESSPAPPWSAPTGVDIGPVTVGGTPAPTTTHALPAAPPTSAATASLSLLSDTAVDQPDSWWRQVVQANSVPGVVMGVVEADPVLTATTLAGRLDAVSALKGFVLVQSGTNDLIAGTSPDVAAVSIEALWQGVVDRGGKPVAALLPPSNSQRSRVITLNEALRTAAQARGIPVLDVYSPVADTDGSWANAYTDDGVVPNAEGSRLQSQAALEQLSAILAPG